MKKILALLLALVMVLSLAACASSDSDKGNNGGNDAVSADSIPDEMTSSDGKYQVAFVTDVGTLKDKSFNQGTYDGVKLYANENGKSYKYYQPANGNQATDEDRAAAFITACENGAEVVVAAGYMQEAALRTAALKFPDVHFIFIDGYPVVEDPAVEDSPVLSNVAGIAFDEQQSGYLAGYAAVMEGYTKLGFCGGGGGTNPACVRFGYGFVQGADAAAAAKGVTVEMNYSWSYGSSFSASPELQAMTAGWYQNGTEVIFCCGGGMFTSVAGAAGVEDGNVIGVDVDQSYESDTVITSAMKGLADATKWAIAKHYNNEWTSIGGLGTSLGAADNAVGLPTDTWSLKNWSVDDYNALYAKIAAGEVEISSELLSEPASTANVTVTVVK